MPDAPTPPRSILDVAIERAHVIALLAMLGICARALVAVGHPDYLWSAWKLVVLLALALWPRGARRGGREERAP